ncbi:Chromatin modification-related protein eaf3 [Penicillium malachiteum]|uniref:Chromatin modification-related protein eaf3 n=1 Tax=Penicillium malachiteum TaxID=1324776 RepID=UPI002549BA9E|nr:Chromatin modification-related protein eaf3 [Penicillium malachiteum]KAJ5720761.1 Chromatin modification-related protein eaf3 [Penicillium malachiteum]
MAPSTYSSDEKVLCFHHEILYEAKVLEVRHKDPQDKKSPYEYRVHYKGWKNTWDDWVREDRLRKWTDENRELATNIRREAEASLRAKNSKQPAKKRATSDRSSVRDSEERGNSVPGRGNKRARETDIERKVTLGGMYLSMFPDPDDLDTSDMNLELELNILNDPDDAEQEDHFHARPSIRIVMPDNLKSLLVDDWERVTKNGTIVKLPAPKPVRDILDDWREEERPKRNRIDNDVLDEVVAGLAEYFEKVLDKILLYRYERHQYRLLRKKYSGSNRSSPVAIYGAEHMIRLISLLPELLAQTTMDYRSTGRSHEEISKFSIWLSRNSDKYFRTEYVDSNELTEEDV